MEESAEVCRPQSPDHLTKDRRVVAPSHALVAPRITEFGVRETIDEAEDFEDA